MWIDPIVEETRKLRDEYAAKHDYNIHSMVAELKQWEKDGFPMAESLNNILQPIPKSGTTELTRVRQP